jgi:hypothetical protein
MWPILLTLLWQVLKSADFREIDELDIGLFPSKPSQTSQMEARHCRAKSLC